MTTAELIEALRREQGIRFKAVAEQKRLREITKDKRDLLAIINQLDEEVRRLSSQTGDFWKKMHDERAAQNRRMNQRNRVAMGGLHLATKWLRHFVDGEPEPDAPLFDVFDAWETAISPERLRASDRSVVGAPPEESLGSAASGAPDGEETA